MPEHPIFFDPEGRRRRTATLVGGLLASLLIAVLSTLFVASVFLPSVPVVQFQHRQTTYRDALEVSRHGPSLLTPKVRAAILADARRVEKSVKRTITKRVVLGFYSPGDSAGLQSFENHASALTHVAPQWLHLSDDGRSLDLKRDWGASEETRNVKLEAVARARGVRIIPILDNIGPKGGFERARSAGLLEDEGRQRTIAAEIVAFLTKHDYDGLNLDFEELSGKDSKGLVRFAGILHDAFSPRGLSLSADVEVGNDELDLEALAEQCDFIVPMLYDEHFAEGTQGPIASLGWTQANLAKILETVPESKVVLGVGNYAYDWREGERGAESMSFQEALTAAQGYRSEGPDRVLRFDSASSNTTFGYEDDEGNPHRVWLLDAVSAYNQIRSPAGLGLRGAALWALGEEDPALWSFFNRSSLFKRVAPASLERISFPYEVSFTGRGEILSVVSTSQDGARRVTMDDGLVDSCVTLRYALPYVVAKSGFVPKKVALTFDDGPDRQWTPLVLDELKRLRVPGTFFDIGANAETMPDLVAREYDEGHEVGNHSFTHPDLGSVADWRAKAEVDLAQMAIEAATGHSTALFRPPYNADSEPETPDQLRPVLMAHRLGLITVGENVDPTDWDPNVRLPSGGVRPRSAKDIADFVVADLMRRRGSDDEGNIVLLHDAGGDRSETVRALGSLVPRLRAMGYEFVPVSRLMGTSRDAVMPALSAKDRLYYALGRWGLGGAFAVQGFLATAFVVAIVLGVGRTALIVPLALSRRPREAIALGGNADVSVVIAAYNEAAVIARTVESVLASRGPVREVIVVDDGSTDGTAEAASSNDPRVRVLRKPNGGKASALNEGIGHAKGELLFHIDADTILDPRAIGRLVGHFADARVAAVAGNVQVGNRVNLLTRWQDLEYVTSQNLDRRAYARLNCITVVPGAIGMWRRSAVQAVGGYQTDTLAEDMDLTWRLRRAGFRLENEPGAYAYTEAPERLAPFLKQRFRWSYGTLQCLVKHRSALGRDAWFGWLALPTQWLFGVVFQALAPLVDLQIVAAGIALALNLLAPPSENRSEAISHAQGDFARFLAMYALFTAVELLGAGVALRMERRPLRELLPLLIQRFVYRQMMYTVMYRSLVRALSGTAAGWGKLARTGSVRLSATQD